jgi:outer membrane assembly lipoprotein YfiO
MMNNMKRNIIIATVLFGIVLSSMVNVPTAEAFWVWTPDGKEPINPKFAPKDTPEDQFDWAMSFFKENDFKRAADEFLRLTDSYKESEYAPEAQYYAARAFEEQGKYLFAFENYQTTVEKYPYTKRLEEIVERQYNIGQIFQNRESPKLMNHELNDSLDKAVEVYKKVVDNQTFGNFADKALLSMGDCYRRMKKYSEAIDTYNLVIKDYPKSSLVEEAKYRMAYATYEASLDPEYDQVSTDKAIIKFRKIAKTTSIPQIAEEAEIAINTLQEKKAGSVFQVAEFYEKQKKYKSAMVYYRDVIEKYPGSKTAETAQERLEKIKEVK